eukprot:gene11880-12024_t
MSGRNDVLKKIKARLKDASAQSVARRPQVEKHREERITAAQALWAASTHQEREKLLTIEVQAVRQAIQTYDQDATSTVAEFAGQANNQQKLHQSLQALLERLQRFNRYTFYQWEGLEFANAKQLMHHAAVLKPNLLQTQLQEQRPKGATADCLAENVTDNKPHEVTDACNKVPDDQMVHTAQRLESEIKIWSRPIDWQQPSALGTVDVDAFALTAGGQGLALSTELLQLFEDQQSHKDGQPGSSQAAEEQDKW